MGTRALVEGNPSEVDRIGDRWHKDRQQGEEGGERSPVDTAHHNGREVGHTHPWEEVHEAESGSERGHRNTRVSDFDHDSHRGQDHGVDYDRRRLEVGHVDHGCRIGEARDGVASRRQQASENDRVLPAEVLRTGSESTAMSAVVFS